MKVIGGLLLLLTVSSGSPYNNDSLVITDNANWTTASSEDFQLLTASSTSNSGEGKKSKRKKAKKPPITGFVVPLSLDNDNECYISPKLTFGSSREGKFRVKFDSTVDTLMVFDEKLTNNKLFMASSQLSKTTTKFYDLQDRSSDNATEYSKATGSFTETYPDQSVMSGEWIQDTVKLHRKCATTLELGLVTEIKGGGNKVDADAYMAAYSTDAIMGLGFTRISGGTPIVPPVVRILEQNPLFDTKVSFYISLSGSGSHVSFGSPYPDLVKGGSKAIIYHDLPEGSSKWELDLDEFEYYDVLDVKEEPLRYNRLTAAIETASPFVTLPTKLYNKIIRSTRTELFDGEVDAGRKAVHFAPCANIDEQVSSIRFDIGSGSKKREYTLDIVDLAVEEQPPGGPIEEGEKNVIMCKLQIQDSGSDEDGGRVGLGHPFLQKYYTTFHYMSTEAMVDSRGPSKKYERPTPWIGLGPSKYYADWKHAFRHNSLEKQADKYREEKKTGGGKKSWGKDDSFPEGQKIKKRKEGDRKKTEAN